MTCGSVDDGKSTLIGRLLFDAGVVPTTSSPRSPRQPRPACRRADFSLLLDGLKAEREQGITIDVGLPLFLDTAARASSSPTRRGTSSTRATWRPARRCADLAVVLVDARKGVLPQTRRHARSRADGRPPGRARGEQDGSRRLPRSGFDEIVEDYRAVRRAARHSRRRGHPDLARARRQRRRRSAAMPWYHGPTLLDISRPSTPRRRRGPAVPLAGAVGQPRNADFRGSPAPSLGGSCGPATGRRRAVRAGERTSQRIVTFDGDLDRASAGHAVTLMLDDRYRARRRAVRRRRRAAARQPTSSPRISSGWTRSRCCRAARI